MSNGILEQSSVLVPRATLQGYLMLILGLLLVTENAVTASPTGLDPSELGSLVLGLFGIGGGAYGIFRPGAFPRGTESAPTYLYILTGGATLAFVVALLLMTS